MRWLIRKFARIFAQEFLDVLYEEADRYQREAR